MPTALPKPTALCDGRRRRSCTVSQTGQHDTCANGLAKPTAFQSSITSTPLPTA
jgi:hypothetical protein